MDRLVSAGTRVGRRPLAAATSVGAVALVTGSIYLVRGAVPVLSLGVLYLFAVLPVAVLWGRLYSVLVAIGSMLAFNFFFLPPHHTLALAEGANWFALAVYLVTALVVSDLAARARRRAAEAEQREREEALLAELSIALLQGEHLTAELDRIGTAVGHVLGLEGGRLELDPPGSAAAGETALELRAGERRVGRVYLPHGGEPSAAIRRRFLPGLASLLAVAVDREALEREALAAERLRLSDAVKTAILRAVSHDLRSPLTAIRVAAESLASPSVTLSPADRSRQLETVRSEAQRLDRLVANLLDLSRLQAGAATPRRQLVAVDELVGRALAELGADERRVRVTLPDEVPLVEVDPVQVERTLVNVLDNALRLSPPDAEVDVLASSEGGEAVVRVVDRGPGIDPADLSRVFEPFERGVPGHGDERPGSGLGLAIARGFAEANGGRIWAESGPGAGSSFSLAFPLAPAPVEAAR